jgi:hypothetical protein
MLQTQHGNQQRACNLQQPTLSLTIALDTVYMMKQHQLHMQNKSRQNDEGRIAAHMMTRPLQHRLHQH